MGGCCERAGPRGWCKTHLRAAGERRATYRPDLEGDRYLLPGPGGARFTPDGTGGGVLSFMAPDGTVKFIRKEAHRGA